MDLSKIKVIGNTDITVENPGLMMIAHDAYAKGYGIELRPDVII